MKKFPLYLQDNESSCGAFCIKMLLDYYQRNDTITHIKKKCKITKQGVSIYGLIEVLKDYHIEAKGYQCDSLHLNDIKLPAIVHLKQDNVLHYVILYKKDEHYYYIADPAKGYVKMFEEEFLKVFTGYIVMIEQVGYMDIQHQENTFMQFVLQHLKYNKENISSLVVKTMILSLLSVVTSYYFQIIIDSISIKPYSFLIFATLCYFIVYCLKTLFSYFRQRQIIYLKRELDENYVLKTIQNTLYLEYQLFKQDEQGVFISKAHYLEEFSNYFITVYETLFIHTFYLLVLFIAFLFVDVYLFLIVLLCFIFILFLMIYFQKKLMIIQKKTLEKKESVNNGLHEFYTNFFQVLQFKMKRSMKNKIGYIYDDYYYQQLNKETLINKFQHLIDFIIQSMMIISLCLLFQLYKDSFITVGTILFVYMLLSLMIEPMMQISGFYLQSEETKQIYERYQSLIPEKSMKKKKIKKIKSITLDHLTFSYGYTTPLFERLDLKIDRSIVLKGNVGYGKTTLLKLLSKQLEPGGGNIYFNDINSKDIDDVSFYNLVKYLDKNPVFFKESLIYNMIFDRVELYDSMIELLILFDLKELIDHLHDELDIHGGFLSSGQGQLVMLIRVLLSGVQVCILDEALSNVDMNRFEKVINYIQSKDILLIIVTHQINLVKYNLDCVIMDAGNLVKEEDYGTRLSNHK